MSGAAKKVQFLHVFPSFEAGGTQLRISNTINYMGPGAGHAILCIDGNTSAEYRLEPACEVPIHLAPKKEGPVQFILSMRRKIREIAPRVLLTYNWGATDAIIGARLYGFRPVIHNECGFSHEYDGKKWRRTFARRLLLGGVYRTVVVSESMQQLAVKEFRVPAEKITYIRNGIDIGKFRPWRNEELRRQIAPSPDSVVFGYMGGFRASKNVGGLIRAFAAMRRPGDRLALFGQGAQRAELEQLVRDLGASEQILFMGHRTDMANCYAAIDVYVTASRSEAASNSLLEAMATGLPAVVSDIGDNGVLLCERQRPFVIQATDTAGFSKALLRMASDAELRRALGIENRRRCESEYALERMFREYVTLWEEAARTAVQ